MIEHRRGATLSVTESEAEPVYETVDVQVRRIEEKQKHGKTSSTGWERVPTARSA